MVVPPSKRINDSFLGVTRKTFKGDLLANLIIFLDELNIIDGKVLLALPWEDNQDDLGNTALELTGGDRFKGDTGLLDIEKAYKYLHCITDLCPVAKTHYDIKPKGITPKVNTPLLHVLMTSQSYLSELIWGNNTLSQQATDLSDLPASSSSIPNLLPSFAGKAPRPGPKRNAAIFNDPTRKKRIKPTLSLSDDRCDPFTVSLYFANGSVVFDVCADAGYDESELRTFVLRALSNRCRTERTLRSMATLVAEFVLFAHSCDPPKPFYGMEPLITITSWLSSIADRGFSTPPRARYALRIYDEALNLLLPLNHPGVIAMARNKRTKRIKQAPPPYPRGICDVIRETKHRSGRSVWDAALRRRIPTHDLCVTTVLRY